MTPEEAKAAYEAAPSIDLPQERIEEIVKYAVSGGGMIRCKACPGFTHNLGGICKRCLDLRDGLPVTGRPRRKVIMRSRRNQADGI